MVPPTRTPPASPIADATTQANRSSETTGDQFSDELRIDLVHILVRVKLISSAIGWPSLKRHTKVALSARPLPK
jgi:hypothetical protein